MNNTLESCSTSVLPNLRKRKIDISTSHTANKKQRPSWRRKIHKSDSPYTIKVKRIKCQSIITKLTKRELGFKLHSKSFYLNIVPNLTVTNVQAFPGYLRKFSPDGKYFIVISYCQTTVLIYQYNGIEACGKLLQYVRKDFVNDSSQVENQVRDDIFNTIFTLKIKLNISAPPYVSQLNRECSLFSDDGRYLIVVSSHDTLIPSTIYFSREIYLSNESVTPSSRSFLETYRIILIDLHKGVVTSSKVFHNDKIMLFHNQGIHLFNNTLAVLSTQHQQIYIFKIVDGQLIEHKKIGRFCYEDDHILVSTTYPHLNSHHFHPYNETAIGSLKHRILVALFRKAMAAENRILQLRKFYHDFNHLRELRLWKMQLVTESLLLMKYSSEDVVTMRSSEPSYAHACFFVFYDIDSTEILGVFNNTSETLMYIFEAFCDYFRNAVSFFNNEYVCSPSNNEIARAQCQRYFRTLVCAKFGGEDEAIKRFLSQLPISAQSYSTSPYLDSSLYVYDDKWISLLERPKAIGEYPIKFYSRENGLLKFSLQCSSSNLPENSLRLLIAFTFHPRDPFAISVQCLKPGEFMLNFYLRHSAH